MPRSKRARVVHESKTTKKDHKEQTRRLYANIRECLEQYDHMFVFAVDNMRNTYLKDVRTEFADSRYVPMGAGMKSSPALQRRITETT
jgi:mRNA turnover protein 4